MNIVEIVGQIADLKEIDYRNTLASAVLIELLTDKGIITRQEFARKARILEQDNLAEIIARRRSNMPGK